VDVTGFQVHDNVGKHSYVLTVHRAISSTVKNCATLTLPFLFVCFF
jgi:hypothetical protein